MQAAVPEIMDVSKESDDIVKMYGPDCLVPGTYAANCLLARKLSESGVRFVQLYHQGWDQHSNLPMEMAGQAKDVDQASAALVTDLKQRGLLDETLVIWGGEFGRPITARASWRKSQLWTRPPPPLFQHLDGGRRYKTGHSLWTIGRVWVQHCERPCTCARFPRNHIKPIRPRPYKTNIQKPGPQIPVDRCCG